MSATATIDDLVEEGFVSRHPQGQNETGEGEVQILQGYDEK